MDWKKSLGDKTKNPLAYSPSQQNQLSLPTPKLYPSLKNYHYLYIAYDKDKILYIGITHDMKQRMGHHRSSSPWWKEKNRIMFHKVSSRRKAERLEELFIIKYCPPYNGTHNDGIPMEYIEVKFDQLEWQEYHKDDFRMSTPLTKKNPATAKSHTASNKERERLMEEEIKKETQEWVDFFRDNREKVERLYFNEDKIVAIDYKKVSDIPSRNKRWVSLWNSISIIKGCFSADTGIGDFTIGLSKMDDPVIREALDIGKYEPIDESFYYKTKFWNSIKKDYMNTFFDKCFQSDSPINLVGYTTNTKLLITPSELMKGITAVATTGSGEVTLFYDQGRSARTIHWGGYNEENFEQLQELYSDDEKQGEGLMVTYRLREVPKILPFSNHHDSLIGCDSELDSWYLHYIFRQYDMRKKNKTSKINTNTLREEGFGGDDFFLDMDLSYCGISYEEMNLNITESHYEHLREKAPNFGVSQIKLG